MTDRYGRTWPFPNDELCPECGQPDNCGDCTHDRLSNDEALSLVGDIGGAVTDTTTYQTITDQGGEVVYEPWTDGHAIGFRAIHLNGGNDTFIYLNPSQTEGFEDQPNVFLYVGEHGDPAQDVPYHHYDL